MTRTSMPSSSSTQEESPLNEHVRIWSIKNAARAHAGLPPLPIPPLDPPVAVAAAAAATAVTTTHMEHDVATFEPPIVTVTLEDQKESSIPRRNTTNHMDNDGTTPSSSPSHPPNTPEMTPHRPVPEYTMANHHHRINHGSQNTNTNNGNSQLFVLDTTPQTEPTKNDMPAAALSKSISISAPYSRGTVTPRVMEWPITSSPVAGEKEEAIAGSNKAPPLVVTDNAATIEAWTTHRHDTDTGVVAAVVVMGETSEDQDQHTGEEEEDEPIILWKEMYMDAQEFELASLTLQRPTAVKRLQELAFRLKEASQRLREKQTKDITDEPTKKRSIDDDTTDGNSSGLIGTVPRQQRCKKHKPTTDHTNHDIPTTTITQTLRSPPPLLKATDAWVCHHSAWGGNLCPSFEKDNHCPLGAQCPRTHVYRLGPQIQQQQQQTEGSERMKWTKEDVMQVYERYRQRSLIRQDFAEKIKDHWFSARFKCPMDQIYYYAHGSGGRASPQRLEWYSTQKEAHDAVATLVLHALQLRQMIPANVSPILTPPVSNKRSNSAHRRTTITTPPPLVIPWNWMEPHVEKRCGHFLDSKKTCRFGKFCRFSHVHFPTQLTTTTTSTTTTPATGLSSLSDGAPSDQLIEIYKKQFDVLDPAPLLQDCHFTKSVGEHCTAGFKCPVESTIYYAAGGCHSYINSQNIYLYPSPEDALSAVDCIVLNAFIERGLTTTTSRQNNPKPSSSTQIKNNSHNNTQQGEEEEEEDSDIADMFGSDDEEEDNHEKDTVNQKQENHPNSAETDADVDTHEMFDSDDNTDEQEMFDTNDNTDASGLPVLKHKDWMVPANKKHCKHFVSSLGCRGNHCKYIHVYSTERKKDDGFPTSDHGMPHDDALAFAYRTNFPSTPLLSPRDFCHLCITCEGKQWHTSALTCPREQVIYYAAGGKHAARSSQHIYWYPTQEDAKLAVAAVVLRAFSIRGMYGSGRNPFESE